MTIRFSIPRSVDVERVVWRRKTRTKEDYRKERTITRLRSIYRRGGAISENTPQPHNTRSML